MSVALESLLEAGLVREADNHADGPKYGATFFEPVPEAALVLGLDLGARFLRGAICDLRGHVRARQDVELPGADVDVVLDATAELRGACWRPAASPRTRSTAPSPACRASSSAQRAGSALAGTSPGSRVCRSARRCRSASACR